MTDDKCIENLKELRVIGNFFCFRKGTRWLNIASIVEFYPYYLGASIPCYLQYRKINQEGVFESPLIFSDKEDADRYIESLLIRLKVTKDG